MRHLEVLRREIGRNRPKIPQGACRNVEPRPAGERVWRTRSPAGRGSTRRGNRTLDQERVTVCVKGEPLILPSFGVTSTESVCPAWTLATVLRSNVSVMLLVLVVVLTMLPFT